MQNSMRHDLLLCLQSLSDAEYQRQCWINRQCPPGMEYDNIHIVLSFLLDDTFFLFKPEDEVGRTVDRIDQAQSVQTVSRLLYVVLNEVGHSARDENYIASARWDEVIASAKDALSKLSETH
jgi:hypothetical protein